MNRILLALAFVLAAGVLTIVYAMPERGQYIFNPSTATVAYRDYFKVGPGKILIFCTHDDLTGKSWSSY